jgi:hypothetical protein
MKIVVIRIGLGGDLVSSPPCDECTRRLKEVGIRKICYSVAGGIMVDDLRYMDGGRPSRGTRWVNSL